MTFMEKNPVLEKIKELLENAGDISESKAKEVLKGIGVDEADKAGNAGKKQPLLPGSKGSAEKADTNEGTLPPWLKKGKESDSKDDSSEDDDKEDDNEDDKGEEEDSKEDDKEDDDEEEDDKEEKKTKKESFDIQAHMNALFANESSLTEDFKSKASTIFEAALNERVESLREEIAEEYEEFIAEEIENNRLELVEQLNQYLEYVASEWVKENEIAVENGIKNEITESFIEGLRDLFLNHGIQVPEGDADLMEELYGRIEDLEESLNTEVQRNIELTSLVSEQTREASIVQIGEDLNDTQFDKFVQLAENISYDSAEDLVEKLSTIKESYFTSKNQKTSKKEDDLTPEENSGESQPETISEEISNIAKAISQQYGIK